MKKVLIYPNYRKTNAVNSLGEIVKKLNSLGYETGIYGKDTLPSVDYLLVLGGDGSIIKAAGIAAENNIPVIGINYGKVGYLCQIPSDNLSGLEKILGGEYTIQNRMMLEVTVIRNGKAVFLKKFVLNDAVLSNGPVPRLLEFDMYINGGFAQKIRADGIIFATPTGSTAYSMSAGGPILEPTLSCIIATPICPQHLNIRPCVFEENTVIEIKNTKCSENKVSLSFDGEDTFEISGRDIIRIEKSPYAMPLVKCEGDVSFIERLYSKLTQK